MPLQLDILWRHPDRLSIDLGPLLLVHNLVVKQAWDFESVTFGRIGVKNDLPLSKPLGSQRRPLHVPNCTRAGSTKFRGQGLEAVKHECLGFASLNDSAPLLPVQLAIDNLFAKCGFISFYIGPFLSGTELDRLFGLEYP